ncbi:hypothetical protein [Actinophytocola oryzae]|uniref:Uncharacterized protein n=1 Tax=Actinophytocola oryzae TaxID=502181 RepID=A0A4R7V9B3_9PSEU|nr:hypothetical protein [Actinophytocola oryzae]TDV45505.1 hypothetical protein CLV71_112173 [Actinophytocola oryzae]
MSWLQQLVGKLKSAFGGKTAEGDAATPTTIDKASAKATTEADGPATTEEPTSTAAEPTVADEPTSETPAGTAAPTVVAATEPAPAEEPVTTAEPVATETPIIADEPTASEVVVPVSEPDAPPVEPVTDTPVADAPPVEPVAEVQEPVAEPAAEVRRESSDPAISTLDVEGITAELQAEGPYGPGSGKPAADGSAPSADFTVKGKTSSKLFHTAKSPYFTRTKADVWFKTEADAEGAGFQAWDHKKRAATKK